VPADVLLLADTAEVDEELFDGDEADDDDDDDDGSSDDQETEVTEASYLTGDTESVSK